MAVRYGHGSGLARSHSSPMTSSWNHFLRPMQSRMNSALRRGALVTAAFFKSLASHQSISRSSPGTGASCAAARSRKVASFMMANFSARSSSQAGRRSWQIKRFWRPLMRCLKNSRLMGFPPSNPSFCNTSTNVAKWTGSVSARVPSMSKSTASSPLGSSGAGTAREAVAAMWRRPRRARRGNAEARPPRRAPAITVRPFWPGQR
mmetsp:Transcript_21898/g.68322  ORF Transcript_21898/g.68322 Transcript_21898/m.68322 type:complete len:205 (+) Transcript_21898:282-896(+)